MTEETAEAGQGVVPGMISGIAEGTAVLAAEEIGVAETLTEAGGAAGRAVQSVVLALLPGMLSVKLVLLQHQMVQVCLARLQVHTMVVDLMGPLVEATLLHLHSDTRSWFYKDCAQVV